MTPLPGKVSSSFSLMVKELRKKRLASLLSRIHETGNVRLRFAVGGAVRVILVHTQFVSASKMLYNQVSNMRIFHLYMNPALTVQRKTCNDPSAPESTGCRDLGGGRERGLLYLTRNIWSIVRLDPLGPVRVKTLKAAIVACTPGGGGGGRGGCVDGGGGGY